jgi:hypothetical protein
VPEYFELEAFADAINANRFSEQAVRDAINGVAVLEAIERSGTSGKHVILGQGSV